MQETRDIEYKLVVDLDDRNDQLNLAREIVAFANSGGGAIEIGRADDGEIVGVDADLADKFDPARLGDLIDKFVGAGVAEVRIQHLEVGGLALLRLEIPAFRDPPHPMLIDGTLPSAGRDRVVFRRGDVYVRHGTRAMRAVRADFDDWIKMAVKRERDEILDRLARVVEAPAGSEVRIVTEDQVLDPPNYLLDHQANLFELNSAHLLNRNALKDLWMARSDLRIDSEAKRELLVQSALRRRQTLYGWLGVLLPSPDEIERWLKQALQMGDRDKSDAARSIVELAALYLSPLSYEAIIEAMRGSGYAHIRTAAARNPTAQQVLNRLGSEVASTRQNSSGALEPRDAETQYRLDEAIIEDSRIASRIGLMWLAQRDSEVGKRLRPSDGVSVS